MLTFLPVSILILAILSIIAIHYLRSKFSQFWILASLGAILAWVTLFVALFFFHLPITFSLETWQPETWFSDSLLFRLDSLSWAYSIVLVTLLFAVILTDVIYTGKKDWTTWISALLLTILGLLSLLSGNLLTIILGWAAIDIAQFSSLALQSRSAEESEQTVIAFGTRSTGTFLAICALLLGTKLPVTQTNAADATTASIAGNILLVLACAFRLGIIPLHLPRVEDQSLRRGHGTLLRMLPAMTSVILINRISLIHIQAPFSSILLGLVCFAILYSAFSWLSASDPLEARPYWVLNVASLSLAAALRGQYNASMVWGIALVASGSAIFLASTRNRLITILFIVNCISFSALPYTPTWNGVMLFSPLVDPFTWVLILSHSIVLLGILRHAALSGIFSRPVENWQWLLYTIGLIALPLVQWMFSPLAVLTSSEPIQWPGLRDTIPAMISATILVTMLVIHRFFHPGWKMANFAWLGRLFSLNWLYRLFWNIYRSVGYAIRFIDRVLEGEAGFLWTLLLLVLILSILIQVTYGA